MDFDKEDKITLEVTRDASDSRYANMRAHAPALRNCNPFQLFRPMILIKVPQSYDLVLEFDSEASRKRFLVKLDSFATSNRTSVEMVPVFKRSMLVSAETRERRQRKLEHFFREAYALTFGLKYVKDGRLSGPSCVNSHLLLDPLKAWTAEKVGDGNQ